MATARRWVHHTYAEYVAVEDASPIRHGYLDGEIYAMAGGTPDHSALAARVITLLGAQLPPGCRAFTSDLRIRIAATGLSTYPDGAAVCGKTSHAEDDPIAVTNPALIVEVTSPSTEDYDRGEKLRHYQTLPSLREILLVSHREPRLTLYRRAEDDTWSMLDARPGDELVIDAVAGGLALDDVYRGGLEDLNRR